MKPMAKMLCPACKTELGQGTLESYETLSDHLSCAYEYDEKIEVRQTIFCPNKKCVAHQENVFWAPDGEGPYSKRLLKDSVWIDGNPNPFNSWARQCYFQISYKKQDRTLKLGKLSVKCQIRYKSNDYGDKKGMLINFRIVWGRIYHTSGIHMLFFVLRGFYRNKDKAQEIFNQSKWPRAEWWRKAAAFWVKTFHKNLLTVKTH